MSVYPLPYKISTIDPSNIGIRIAATNVKNETIDMEASLTDLVSCYLKNRLELKIRTHVPEFSCNRNGESISIRTDSINEIEDIRVLAEIYFKEVMDPLGGGSSPSQIDLLRKKVFPCVAIKT